MTVDEVRGPALEALAEVFELELEERARPSSQAAARLTPMETSLPVAERPRRPEWMKVRARAPTAHFDDQEAAARPLAEHGLRGGSLPEHLGVLGPRHGDLPDPR